MSPDRRVVRRTVRGTHAESTPPPVRGRETRGGRTGQFAEGIGVSIDRRVREVRNFREIFLAPDIESTGMAYYTIRVVVHVI